eukprot:TRINITY_DN36944_c0_g1_i1.p1 TRINITY_DN36944_c0_g1~~TRINITY_DN36944_c0_g1_i1.p1  ORF type:complete len:268 (+),score=45.70 TRINITY_DN36944_c0_g1_i1:190-993(+)
MERGTIEESSAVEESQEQNGSQGFDAEELADMITEDVEANGCDPGPNPAQAQTQPAAAPAASVSGEKQNSTVGGNHYYNVDELEALDLKTVDSTPGKTGLVPNQPRMRSQRCKSMDGAVAEVGDKRSRDGVSAAYQRPACKQLAKAYNQLRNEGKQFRNEGKRMKASDPDFSAYMYLQSGLKFFEAFDLLSAGKETYATAEFAEGTRDFFTSAAKLLKNSAIGRNLAMAAHICATAILLRSASFRSEGDQEAQKEWDRALELSLIHI